MIRKLLVVVSSFLLGITGCKKATDSSSATVESTPVAGGKIEVPEWSKNATIYELNVRQFTPEGTFAAIRPHLDRLADMGVKIIWLMPIHPISKTNRKGTLGSYYAVDDFRDVNPEFGTLYDLQVLVNEAHNRDMRIIIDWVPHHTGWDHPWIKEHPEYYNTDSTGTIRDPIDESTGKPWGWTDVAELNFDNQEMRKEVISDMIYWVEEADIDGFRVDHAHGLPDDYWDQVSDSLSKLDKPLFMLAEAEQASLRNKHNFVMDYGWKLHHAMNDIAKGKRDVNIIDTIVQRNREIYTFGYQMNFTSNHDENSWAGTVMERMGDGHKAFAVFAATIDGMPLLYSGQEEPMTKRLEFFEKDPIEWKDHKYHDFYKALFTLKKRNIALWNGGYGSTSERINTHDHVYAFKRERDQFKVIVIVNLSSAEQTTTLKESTSLLRNIFNNEMIQFNAGDSLKLQPWEYIVLSNV